MIPSSPTSQYGKENEKKLMGKVGIEKSNLDEEIFFQKQVQEALKFYYFIKTE